jgi:hypothetical protein
MIRNQINTMGFFFSFPYNTNHEISNKSELSHLIFFIWLYNVYMCVFVFLRVVGSTVGNFDTTRHEHNTKLVGLGCKWVDSFILL